VLKHVVYYCNLRFKSNDALLPPPTLVIEYYDYGEEREEVLNFINPATQIPDGVKDFETLEWDTEMEVINGMYRGWLYVYELTGLYPYNKLVLAYVDIDRETIKYYKNPDETEPAY
jgi:hypothetical protein